MGFLAFAVLIGVAAGFFMTGDRLSTDEKLSGHARVIDGDTFELAGTRVRLWGVDAPEQDQVCEEASRTPYLCGQEAQQALRGLVAGTMITCARRGRDQYGRFIGKCLAGDQDLGSRLVQGGNALDYTQYSRGAYLLDELRARRAGVGVWRGRFVRPDDWRHAR